MYVSKWYNAPQQTLAIHRDPSQHNISQLSVSTRCRAFLNRRPLAQVLAHLRFPGLLRLQAAYQSRTSSQEHIDDTHTLGELRVRDDAEARQRKGLDRLEREPVRLDSPRRRGELRRVVPAVGFGGDGEVRVERGEG